MDEPKDDDEIDRLLARGGLSGDVRERIADKLLASKASPVRDAKPPALVAARRVRAVGVATGIAALAASLFFLVRPAADRPELTPKGAPGAAGPRVEVACASSGGARCRPGETLLFRVADAPDGGLVSAYLVGPSGVIWAFSSEDDAPPPVSARPGTQALPRGLRIGETWPSGRYRVVVAVADRPLSHDELRARGDDRNAPLLEIEVSP